MTELPSQRDGILRRMVIHVQTRVGAGLLIILPIGVTILIFKFFFDLLDPQLQPLLKYLPGPNVPGMGVAALLILVYLVGLIATHVVGRSLIERGHRIMEYIPGVKGIYSTTRTAVQMLGGSRDRSYRGVVLVQFPREGSMSIGLITANLGNHNGEEMVAVYIPTTPVPSSGFLVVVPIKDVTVLDMSVEDAMKIVISGGILAREVFPEHLSQIVRATRPQEPIPAEEAQG